MLAPDLCYRALKSRDPRFDGRFFTGVHSTGIFCRPVCPAVTPRREHCQFFASAAAAIRSGFRPCLRCSPEVSPDAPAWNGTSATVTRALRLIGEGALDEASLDGLAARLGVGARHLRRLFDEQVGASPVSVALARRVFFAKRLMTQTTLPLTQIALASGFRSIRRFNDAFRSAFQRAPREIRRLAGEPSASIEIKLVFRPPYDWKGVLAFLAAHAAPNREVVRDGEWIRRLLAPAGPGSIRVRFRGDHLAARIEIQEVRLLRDCVCRLERVFDLGADPARIAEQLGRAAFPGIRVPGAWDDAAGKGMHALRVLRDPDVYPAVALGLPDPGPRAEAWRPWRAYAAMSEWRKRYAR